MSSDTKYRPLSPTGSKRTEPSADNVYSRPRLSRRWGSLMLSACFVLAICGLVTSWRGGTLLSVPVLQFQHSHSVDASQLTPTGIILDKSHYVKGPPAKSFRENLKPDVQYVTTWHYAGLTNDFMVMCNLIYLGLITRRIPILPPFAPAATHVRDAKPVPFGQIFDIPALSRAIQWPILDWADVKKARYNESFHYGDQPLPEVDRDELGCWSNWAGLDQGHRAAHSITTEFLALDIIYTAVPQWVKLGDLDWDYHASFSGMASLLTPQGRVDALDGKEPLLTMTFEEKMKDLNLDPDNHMACFDLLYYVGAKESWEWTTEHFPAWDLVATHARFLPGVEAVVDGILRNVFELEQDMDLPKFISIHVRRTDFKQNCPANVDPKECFAPLSAYARRVSQVKDDLLRLRNVDVKEVVITSDEVDPEWWSEVRALGWRYVDHDAEQTSEKYGTWFPTVIDKAIQARGAGFVGTEQSTMSIVAELRVRDWNHGFSRSVRWGQAAADQD